MSCLSWHKVPGDPVRKETTSTRPRRTQLHLERAVHPVGLAGHAVAICVSQLGREVARRREVGKVDVNPRSVTPLGST